jgi:putative sterol carrier protein
VVAVKFLSDEWASAVKMALNEDQEFRTASAGKTASIQQIITGPDGQTDYWIKIDDGSIDMGVGDAPAPDATITQSYDTATALARSELSAVTAYMTGKIKIGGNLGLLLGLQTVLARLPAAMASIETDY